MGFDSKCFISNSRPDLNKYKQYFRKSGEVKCIGDIINKVDVIIGLSKGNVLKKEDLLKMPPNPIIFALANPTPEIDPSIASLLRKDLIIATGRSDYHNQINNLICFPY